MSTSLDVYDPEFDSIFHVAIQKAYEEILKDRSNTSKQASQGGPKKTSTNALKREDPLAFRQEIVVGVVKRLEDHFKKNNQQNILTTEQMRLIQERCFKQMNELQYQNKNNVRTTISKQDKSNLNKFITGMLFIVALKYSSGLFAKINAIKNLKKKKQLLAAYKKWKRRKIRQLKEREMEARAQEEATQDPRTLAEQERKRDEAYEAEVKLLWGDLINPGHRGKSSDATVELAAVIAAESLGDHVHDTISNLHKDLELPDMHPEHMAQFKNEVEGFKQALFEIDTSLARPQPDKGSETVIAEAYANFEHKILGPLDKWRQKATDLIMAKGENVAKKLLELDNKFLGITQSLSSWARGEHHRAPQITATDENKMNQEAATIEGVTATPMANTDDFSVNPLRVEKQRLAGEAARRAGGGLAQFELRTQTQNSKNEPAVTAEAEISKPEKPFSPKPAPPV